MSHEVERRKASRTSRTTTTTDKQHDVLVSDAVAAAELGGVTRMTIFRWDHDPTMTQLGFPPRVMLNGRGYRSRQQLEKFKANLMRKAIAARDEVA
jgi:hypothetical protein